jgi:hypothetical protein
MYSDNFNKPFFVTYAGAASFAVNLLGFLYRSDWRRRWTEFRNPALFSVRLGYLMKGLSRAL